MDILIVIYLVFALLSLAVFEAAGATEHYSKVIYLVCVAFFVVIAIITLSLRLLGGT